MIYDDNKKKSSLDRELFKSPPAEYRAAPFWAWNCDLDRDELLRQIDIFKERIFSALAAINAPLLSSETVALSLDDVFYTLCVRAEKSNDGKEDKR